MTYQLYWGDLHSHCSVSYGGGTVEQALARARGQLDFCSITGHAFWPDMPQNRERYGQIIDYHREGFARLTANWDGLLAKLNTASKPGLFIALPSYEWHSLKYGDHNVYAAGPALPLSDAPDLPGLRNVASEAGGVIIPHHIGYAAGYRGLDWRHFDESRSPFVEIFSLHGASESEDAPLPYLHDMGPRDAGSMAEAGWEAGHRFGVIASTDHHGGYPGSHGDGRAAVLARELTRESIWEALLARRVYAATGDKIDARLLVDDAEIGSVIESAGERRIRIRVYGSGALDRVELVKNASVLCRFFPDLHPPKTARQGYRLRISWGWGRKDQPVRWDCRLSLAGGTIRRVEPCFSGHAVVAPQGVGGHEEAPDDEDLPHEIVEQNEESCAWRSVTTGNISTRHPTIQSISLEIEATIDAQVVLEANGKRFVHPLGELFRAGRAHYLRGWLSEAVRLGPAVPLTDCTVEAALTDGPQRDVDYYRLRVAQKNGQHAWLTPIWVSR